MSNKRDRDEFGRGYFKQNSLGGLNRPSSDPNEIVLDDYELFKEIPHPVDCKNKANLIGSIADDGINHLPCIDIDHNISVHESSPGKFHLYINKKITKAQYDLLLDAMNKCGLVELGFLNSFRMKGMTFLRPIWLKKKYKDEL